ncbi:MAG: cytochrome c [Bacteroidales bacterium]
MRTDPKIDSMRRGAAGKFLVVLLGLVLLIAGCDRGPNDPGRDYFPDMVYSPAYQTWSENPVNEGGVTMMPPVEGTVPRNMIPFQYERTAEDQLRAGRELVNPFDATAENVERGREAYSVYCMNCHGEKGDGPGHLFTSGRYLVPPSSLVDEKITALPDGSIYHTISLGYGIMAEHASLILPRDRWKIILYIRQELQGKRFELHDMEEELPVQFD